MSWRALTISAAFAALSACGEPTPAAPDAAPDAAPVGQGSEARNELAINEVAPQTGGGSDWLEIINRSDTTIDLCNYFVTDDLDRLDHYLPLGNAMPPDPCEPRLFEAGDYLVIYADDDAATPDHAPFRLGIADAAHVVTITGTPVDSFVYLFPEAEAGQSLARTPDGEGLFFVVDPTPGAANPEGDGP
jgi:hypothetical protein